MPVLEEHRKFDRMPENDDTDQEAPQSREQADENPEAKAEAADGSFVTGLSKEEEDRLLKVTHNNH